eukprot:11213099-Lingulodinium_polyedra.AAC.1
MVSRRRRTADYQPWAPAAKYSRRADSAAGKAPAPASYEPGGCAARRASKSWTMRLPRDPSSSVPCNNAARSGGAV